MIGKVLGTQPRIEVFALIVYAREAKVCEIPFHAALALPTPQKKNAISTMMLRSMQ
jgi:hypothetical protein|eukprot:COSAG02_NODE_1634_length_11565_cov_4.754666_3_plen_56_part_00